VVGGTLTTLLVVDVTWVWLFWSEYRGGCGVFARG
jgi:hypothetical protein